VSVVRVGDATGTTDMLAHYLIDHDEGVGRHRRSNGNCSIQPQQRTTPAPASTSPILNQHLPPFQSAYPPLSILTAASEDVHNISTDMCSPIDGADVLLVVTVHDALGVGRTQFLGKAVMPVKMAQANNHWVVLRARDGGQLLDSNGRSPALLLRVGYSAVLDGVGGVDWQQ